MQCFWKSDQRLLGLLQKETEWQSNFFVKTAGKLFCSTNDPLLIHLLCPLGGVSFQVWFIKKRAKWRRHDKMDIFRPYLEEEERGQSSESGKIDPLSIWLYDHRHTYFFHYDVLFSVPVDNAPSSPPRCETMIEPVTLLRELHQIQKTQCQVKGLTICQKEANY